LGLIAIARGNGGSSMIRYPVRYPYPIRYPAPPRPPIVPVVEKPPIVVAPRPMPAPTPVPAPAPAPVSTAATAGTPVPAGYSTNQFFVSPDASVWEYSATNAKWFNTGTPYNTGAAATPAAAAASSSLDTSSSAAAPAQPVSVTVAPAMAASGYQAILDWLTRQDLITGVPNWIVGGGVALLAWKLTQKGKK
jgi:hypothetical protein